MNGLDRARKGETNTQFVEEIRFYEEQFIFDLLSVKLFLLNKLIFASQITLPGIYA